MTISTLVCVAVFSAPQPPAASAGPQPVIQPPTVAPAGRPQAGVQPAAGGFGLGSSEFGTGVFPFGATMVVADPSGVVRVQTVVTKTVTEKQMRKVPMSGPDGQTTYRDEAVTVTKPVFMTDSRPLPPDAKIYRNGREISAEERSSLRQPTPIFVAKIGSPNAAPGQGYEQVFGDALVAYIPNHGMSMPTVPSAVPMPSATRPSTKPPQNGGDLSNVEKGVIEKTNAARAEAGLQPLKVDATLTKAARQHSDNMAKQEKFEHFLDGKGPHDRLVDLGMQPFATGENVAQGQNTAGDAMTTWMSSEGHKANILNPQYTHIGVAKSEGAGGPYWTQVFARTGP